MSRTKLVAALLVALVVPPSRFLAQDDHAPLPGRCIADYDLWSAGPRDSDEKLPLTVIQTREIEMWNCAKVIRLFDSEHNTAYSFKMLLLSDTYSGDVRHRALDFIQRHGLMKEFSQEDTAGQR